jgi:hypothetical protein
MQGKRVCTKCLEGKSYKKFRGYATVCKPCSPPRVGVSHKLDIEYLLEELRWDFVFGGARRNNRTLEDLMLNCERNIRLMEADEVRQYALSYQRSPRTQARAL